MRKLAFRITVFPVITLVVLLTLSASGTPAGQKQVSGPEQVAQKLYRSWRIKNRRAAGEVATKEAVKKLFGVRWRSMRFEGCERKEEGGWQCVYREENDDFSVAMEVDGGVSVGGYNVVAVSFSTEAL